MFISNKNTHKIAWIAGGFVLLLLLAFLFSSVGKQAAISNTTSLLIIGLILGALLMFLIWRLTTSGKQRTVKEDSHTVVESIKKVFKIVTAEGHFNELYNYEETRKLLGFIPSTKRALVIIEA
ncbi:MAG: DUF4230 domain-containing protein, partial [Flavisolibacter sp.]|nr:DUF4230 domain-containing protein [Flavisolibacter sp.]